MLDLNSLQNKLKLYDEHMAMSAEIINSLAKNIYEINPKVAEASVFASNLMGVVNTVVGIQQEQSRNINELIKVSTQSQINLTRQMQGLIERMGALNEYVEKLASNQEKLQDEIIRVREEQNKWSNEVQELLDFLVKSSLGIDNINNSKSKVAAK